MTVIGFDFDGTLVQTWTATPLPGVRERLAELPEGTRTFIATNQAGPVFRAMLQDGKYPTAGGVAVRIVAGLTALDWLPDLLIVCTHPGRYGDAWQIQAGHVANALRAVLRACLAEPVPAWRKPAPGMLLEAARHFDVALTELTYVGDMQTDHQAAIAAGCRYLDAAVWRERGLGDA
jgi:FMN phosphatase YigB (HAD superfamily)